MFVTQSHLKELVACNYCNFSHHKDTVCKKAPKEKPDGNLIKKKSNKPIKKGKNIPTPNKTNIQQTNPNSSQWVIVLDVNTPEKNREAILKAIKKFNIKLD